MSEQEHNINIPSGRIRFALDALKEWENTEGCEVDIEDYHTVGGGVCYACLGGAASFKRWPEAFKYRQEIFDRYDFHHFIITDKPKVKTVRDFENSLDAARTGDVDDMFNCMHIGYMLGYKYNRRITDYHENRDRFFADMHKLADDLEKDGY